ncbi:MAG: protein translocase SEC61 complex subunit gamma [Methanomicrobiales archaeon]|nr:protein translocase SEC61 complex subunit gamma [Methanomicrobiales archaeon]
MAVKIEEELFNKYWRVIKLARTPTRDEYSKIAIVAAAGIFLVGLIGFIVFLIMNVLPQ